MRITNQMLAKTAAKSGIPLQQNTLLDIMNKKKSSSDNWFSSIGNTEKTNSLLQGQNTKNSKQLEAAAESLSDYAAKLYEEGEGSLFAEAEATGDTSKLVETITKMADSYNKTVKYLKGTDSMLNQFYLQELKGYVSENKKAMEKAGVTLDKDGSLRVAADVLKAADLETLKAAFGSGSGFTEKTSYVGSRVAENAVAAQESLAGTYGSNGKEYLNAIAQNKYNFWG